MISKFSQGLSSQVAIAIGMICLALSQIAEHFVPQSDGMDFLTGMLVGLSITMNIWGLLRFRAQRVRSGQ